MKDHTERDAALTALAYERSITDALFREFQRLMDARMHGPAAKEARAVQEITRLFEARNER